MQAIQKINQQSSTVTIVTAARDAEKFFAACARSVLAQTHAAWRWIIVNDGSTDNTLPLAREIEAGDERVRVLNQEKKGVSAARNAAFCQSAESVAEFVLFLDADDELTPQALANLVALARRYPGAPVVCGAFTIVDEKGALNEWMPTSTQLHIRQSGLLDAATLDVDNPLWNPAQALIRRGALESVMEEGGVFDQSFSIGEDWDLWKRLSRLGTFVCDQFVTVYYRKHPEGVTTKRRPELLEAMARVKEKHKENSKTARAETTLIDPLHRVEIPRYNSVIKSKAVPSLAIWTMASQNFDGLLDSMLGSLRERGELSAIPGAQVFVLNMGNDEACRNVIYEHALAGLDVWDVPCRALARPNPMLKAAMYAAAEIVEADYYLCLDADTLVLRSLLPLWEQLRAAPKHKVLCAQDANGDYHWANMDFKVNTTGEYLAAVYDLWLPTFEAHWAKQGVPPSAIQYVCNDGVFGGSRQAMLQLAQTLHSWMPRERAFLDSHHIRNQLLFNLALAKNDAFARMDDLFNVQVHAVKENLEENANSLIWHHEDGVKQPAIVHFTGYMKRMFPALQNHFRLATQPIATRPIKHREKIS